MDYEKLAHDLYKKFNARDADGVAEFLHPDVEWINKPKSLYIHGLDKLRASWTKQKDIAIVHFDVTSVTPKKGGFFVVVQEKVWTPDKKLLFDGPVGHDYRVKDAQIIRCDIVDADAG